jgi:hypothetical protein
MGSTGVGNNPAGRMFARCIENNRFVIIIAASPYAYKHEKNYAAFKFHHNFLLSVAGNAALIVGTAMTTVTAGRVEFPFNFVHGHEVAAVGHLTIGTVSVFNGGFHFDLIGVAVVAE